MSNDVIRKLNYTEAHTTKLRNIINVSSDSGVIPNTLSKTTELRDLYYSIITKISYNEANGVLSNMKEFKSTGDKVVSVDAHNFVIAILSRSIIDSKYYFYVDVYNYRINKTYTVEVSFSNSSNYPAIKVFSNIICVLLRECVLLVDTESGNIITQTTTGILNKDYLITDNFVIYSAYDSSVSSTSERYKLTIVTPDGSIKIIPVTYSGVIYNKFTEFDSFILVTNTSYQSDASVKYASVIIDKLSLTNIYEMRSPTQNVSTYCYSINKYVGLVKCGTYLYSVSNSGFSLIESSVSSISVDSSKGTCIVDVSSGIYNGKYIIAKESQVIVRNLSDTLTSSHSAVLYMSGDKLLTYDNSAKYVRLLELLPTNNNGEIRADASSTEVMCTILDKYVSNYRAITSGDGSKILLYNSYGYIVFSRHSTGTSDSSPVEWCISAINESLNTNGNLSNFSLATSPYSNDKYSNYNYLVSFYRYNSSTSMYDLVVYYYDDNESISQGIVHKSYIYDSISSKLSYEIYLQYNELESYNNYHTILLGTGSSDSMKFLGNHSVPMPVDNSLSLESSTMIKNTTYPALVVCMDSFYYLYIIMYTPTGVKWYHIGKGSTDGYNSFAWHKLNSVGDGDLLVISSNKQYSGDNDQTYGTGTIILNLSDLNNNIPSNATLMYNAQFELIPINGIFDEIYTESGNIIAHNSAGVYIVDGSSTDYNISTGELTDTMSGKFYTIGEERYIFRCNKVQSFSSKNVRLLRGRYSLPNDLSNGYISDDNMVLVFIDYDTGNLLK